MIELHPQIINKGENKEFVVLPYEEFVALQDILADAEDLLQLREAKHEERDSPTISLNEVKKHFALE